MEGGDQDQQPLIEGGGGGASEMVEEARKQVQLAVPLIAVSILQYSLQLISIMFVGHLGQLPLSSASIATSFAAVTGFSVLLGLGSALETLCGQSFGARHYQMLGTHTQTAMLSLLTLTIPLAIVWSYTGHILTFLGQDRAISAGATDFNRPMIPALFAFAILQCLNRFLQAQSLVLPLVLSSGLTAALHLLLCWALVVRAGLGLQGAALANSVSYWVNVVMLVVYVEFSPSCRKTWTGFSVDAVREISGFMKLAVPSAIMICLEYWSFEMIVLLSGLLPNPKLETSVLSISLSTCWMVYMISVGLGGAISTRVSNELGARRAKGARLALLVMVSMAITLGLVVFTTTVLSRNVWGKLYSNDREVVGYVAKMMPLLAVSNFLDGFQCVLSGAARGCGWQNACAIINLGAYYFVALPCAVLFAFVFKIGGMGLWMGIICGLSVQVISLVTLNLRKNWTDEPEKVSKRIRSCSISINQHSAMATTTDETTKPLQGNEGKGFATLCCWFLGLGCLLAWNSMLTIADYYYEVFPKYHPSRVLTLMYQPCAVGSMIYLAWNEAKIDTRRRNIIGYSLFAISGFLLIVLDLATHGKGLVIAYVFLCLLCGCFGVADALVQGGMVGDLSFMDPVFLQSFFGGLAASGSLTSGLRLITKAVFDKSKHGLRYGALLFLAISTALEFLCILLYTFVFPRIPIIKNYRSKAASEGSKTVTSDLAAAGVRQEESKAVERLTTKELIKQNWDYALDLYLIYVLTLSIFPGFLYENTGTHGLGSWYPLVLVAMYNVWDLVSRYTPLIGWLRIRSRMWLLAACVARVVFIPAFYYTAKYGDQGWMILLTSLLGLTNGHLTVCVMMAYPAGYKGPEQNALGNALVVFLLCGIFSGAALDWLWIIGKGSF